MSYHAIVHGRKHDHSLALDNNILNPLSLKIGGTEVITSSRVLQNIASFAQDWIPDGDGTRDIGSPSKLIDLLYVKSGIRVKAGNIQSLDDALQLWVISATSYLNGASYRIAGGDHASAPGDCEIYLGDRRAGKTPNSKFQIRMQSDGTLTIIYTLDKDGNLNVLGGYKVGGVAGVSGSFTTVDGKTVTVTKGLITSIV